MTASVRSPYEMKGIERGLTEEEEVGMVGSRTEPSSLSLALSEVCCAAHNFLLRRGSYCGLRMDLLWQHVRGLVVGDKCKLDCGDVKK